ncbi:hypothetical protein [uncultured Nitratireductor sp.]|uniref:hypothetical protein n=1 Tax=uncultured Nitratireductor sp. TaxID=520953 RepID=UPI0025FE6AB5|nr:hypothetical protein [uncultured Nitratireductor sp.]
MGDYRFRAGRQEWASERIAALDSAGTVEDIGIMIEQDTHIVSRLAGIFEGEMPGFEPR